MSRHACQQPIQSGGGLFIAARPQPVAKPFDLFAKSRVGPFEADPAEGLYDGEVLHESRRIAYESDIFIASTVYARSLDIYARGKAFDPGCGIERRGRNLRRALQRL